MAPTHYERLGVGATATTEEIRTAYRSLARRLHPDRQGAATAAERRVAERRMREVNESWQVLRDPDRRRAYDRDRLGRSRSAATGPAPAAAAAPVEVAAGDDDLVDVAPPVTGLAGVLFRHLPWVVLVVLFGVIFLFTAYAGGGDGAPAEAPPPTDLAGRCVDVAPGPVTTVVDCAGPHELEIVVRVDERTACPEGTERRRLGDDGLLDCVVPG